MTTDSTLIRNAAWAVVWDAAAGRHAYARGVDIALAGGRIAAIAPHDPAAPPPAGAAVVDGRDTLVLPGLVNVHTHPTTEPAYRGVREDHGVPEQAMTGLFERMQAFRLDPEGQRAAMRLAYAELMAAGVTSVVDLTSPFEGWLDVMRESGLRVWVGPGYASARWGMSAPQTVTWIWDEAAGRRAFQRAQAIMDEAERDPSGRLSGIVFPAQIDTVEEGLLRDSLALAEATGRPFTTHIAQAVVEVREILRRHGVTPIQYAARLGLLTPRTILGHAIFVDEHPSVGWHTRRDLALMAGHGVAVAHCPSPFARYGEHLRHFGRYAARGVRMAMGTDCAPHNLIEEMRLALLLARNAARDLAAADTAAVFHAATVGGADALGRPDLGRLAVGARADVVLVDLRHPLMTPPRDPLRALVFHAADRAVRRVYVDGRLVHADGRPVRLDLREAAGTLAEAQARMLRDAARRDYRGRDGDAIAPLALPFA
ncbi:amidohydrolase family protein [Caldovatus aquaticus]|uniref:Amidohydrolase family protein n=1 Tax=Caldovatus aquaticus TaxID=2865671 RepID=A0ABS7F0D5_9PROT|nr:amidohydrolase family protein [Caldovatus aquaticus]MBW8269073.1 amidohydrolase family protein [Caldovatus aquaticus]